jgi:hypothetical protein
MPYRFLSDGRMQTTEKLRDWLVYINKWYAEDYPDKRVTHINYITASTLIFYVEILRIFPDWSKSSLFSGSKQDQAEKFIRRDPDGAVVVTKPWDLFDFIAENADVQLLPRLRESQLRSVRSLFGPAYPGCTPKGQAFLDKLVSWYLADVPHRRSTPTEYVITMCAGCCDYISHVQSTNTPLIEAARNACQATPQTDGSMTFPAVEAANFFASIFPDDTWETPVRNAVKNHLAKY